MGWTILILKDFKITIQHKIKWNSNMKLPYNYQNSEFQT